MANLNSIKIQGEDYYCLTNNGLRWDAATSTLNVYALTADTLQTQIFKNANYQSYGDWGFSYGSEKPDGTIGTMENANKATSDPWGDISFYPDTYTLLYKQGPKDAYVPLKVIDSTPTFYQEYVKFQLGTNEALKATTLYKVAPFNFVCAKGTLPHLWGKQSKFTCENHSLKFNYDYGCPALYEQITGQLTITFPPVTVISCESFGNVVRRIVARDDLQWPSCHIKMGEDGSDTILSGQTNYRREYNVPEAEATNYFTIGRSDKKNMVYSLDWSEFATAYAIPDCTASIDSTGKLITPSLASVKYAVNLTTSPWCVATPAVTDITTGIHPAWLYLDSQFVSGNTRFNDKTALYCIAVTQTLETTRYVNYFTAANLKINCTITGTKLTITCTSPIYKFDTTTAMMELIGYDGNIPLTLATTSSNTISTVVKNTINRFKLIIHSNTGETIYSEEFYRLSSLSVDKMVTFHGVLDYRTKI